jgi:hypothetical protein
VDGTTEVASSGPVAVGDLVIAVISGSDGVDLVARAKDGAAAESAGSP